ncbi:UbiX family flavin prenyltransferase [Hydrotalea sandarakina]|jgi:4-hydroxy-3-polyprenylbenzoate decarboxylase|uniref:Flavin prenyltransferase UbiX n=1 Tax=Hydrotalea sandarakina TaxID=1004304 RepID=A0A2W7RM07_9BACT|nr:UbiX family flavin prenyltransferase [Hydrotalea sandarakina]PZX61823.1 4-hydroxy-3-polyprenylbenzoate decarboxylase [Hydrotalea sandarakina]
MQHKIIVAISGASGAIYAKLLLDRLVALKEQIANVGIVMSKNAQLVWETELGNNNYSNYPFQYYTKYDFSAPFASGSAQYNTMIVAPCSMGTMGRIAAGISDDLVTRAADVILKERRKLILMIRDTPYNLIHIKNMETITLAGGIILPATPSFYHQPKTIEDVAASVVDRALDIAGINISTFRWGS